jgi:hypothetical protein
MKSSFCYYCFSLHWWVALETPDLPSLYGEEGYDPSGEGCYTDFMRLHGGGWI